MPKSYYSSPCARTVKAKKNRDQCKSTIKDEETNSTNHSKQKKKQQKKQQVGNNLRKSAEMRFHELTKQIGRFVTARLKFESDQTRMEMASALQTGMQEKIGALCAALNKHGRATNSQEGWKRVRNELRNLLLFLLNFMKIISEHVEKEYELYCVVSLLKICFAATYFGPQGLKFVWINSILDVISDITSWEFFCTMFPCLEKRTNVDLLTGKGGFFQNEFAMINQLSDETTGCLILIKYQTQHHSNDENRLGNSLAHYPPLYMHGERNSVNAQFSPIPSSQHVFYENTIQSYHPNFVQMDPRLNFYPMDVETPPPIVGSPFSRHNCLDRLEMNEFAHFPEPNENECVSSEWMCVQGNTAQVDNSMSLWDVNMPSIGSLPRNDSSWDHFF